MSLMKTHGFHKMLPSGPIYILMRVHSAVGETWHSQRPPALWKKNPRTLTAEFHIPIHSALVLAEQAVTTSLPSCVSARCVQIPVSWQPLPLPTDLEPPVPAPLSFFLYYSSLLQCLVAAPSSAHLSYILFLL